MEPADVQLHKTIMTYLAMLHDMAHTKDADVQIAKLKHIKSGSVYRKLPIEVKAWFRTMPNRPHHQNAQVFQDTLVGAYLSRLQQRIIRKEVNFNEFLRIAQEVRDHLMRERRHHFY